MKKLMKRKVMIIFAMAMIIAMNTMTVFASNDNYGYSYTVKAEHGNTYTTSQYRQTTNTKNKWKVDMTYSGEGVGTVTTYWLALFNDSHGVVSGTHNVKQGSGAHYYEATSGASQKNVCLGFENNNYSTNTYTVSGYWDEETN